MSAQKIQLYHPYVGIARIRYGGFNLSPSL